MQSIDSKPAKRTRPVAQSLHAIQIADALLKIQTVMAVTGMSESTIRRRVAEGKFPSPIKDGTRCIAYGRQVCSLYRFTDEAVYELPKVGVKACQATDDWKRFEKLLMCKKTV